MARIIVAVKILPNRIRLGKAGVSKLFINYALFNKQYKVVENKW